MSLIIFDKENANWLIEEDEQCETPGCTDDTKYILRLVGTIWWCPLCETCLEEDVLEHRDGLDVLEVEEGHPLFTFEGGL